jgi:transposase, IS5 family
MFRTVADQVSLWEAVLPAELLRLPDELARVDALLDDEVFFGPFEPFFDPRIGRPSTPMEVYLRLMFLKFRYRLGYETLCREVADSFTWRRFCRIPFDGAVPHPTTLMKLTTRCGSTAVDGLNRALLAKAVEAKVVRINRVRADTTVVPANVAYPTDSGLLAKAVRRIGSNVKRIQAAGGAVRTRVRDRSRSAGSKAHGIAARLRSRAQLGRDEAKAGVQRITGELAGLAQAAVTDARKLLVNARRAASRARVKAADLAAAGVPDPAAGRRRGRLVRAINDLKRLVEATEKIIEQARLRIKGIMPDGASRVVSLHDTQARPIAKGRLGKPVEFGFKGQFVDNEDGLVLDHNIELGNPPDAPQLAPAIDRVTERTGRAPRVVTADRGYGEAGIDEQILDLGVRTVVIPRKGKPGKARQAVEHSRAFRRHVKWRTGCEGRVSSLKHQYGWDRTRIDSLEGARTWTGQGVFTNNLIRIAKLTRPAPTSSNARSGRGPVAGSATPRPRPGPRSSSRGTGGRPGTPSGRT